jgi:hypothetical protein
VEIRWLTAEEQKPVQVESGAVSEILALAQKLQADREDRFTEAQVVEMGQELGIRPEHVREALRLKRAPIVSPPIPSIPSIPASPPDTHAGPLTAVGHVALTTFALGLLPHTIMAAERTFMGGSSFLWMPFIVAGIAGWVARSRSLAGVAGAAAVPLVMAILITYSRGGGADATFFLSLLSVAPLCGYAARGAARLRRWMERLAERQERQEHAVVGR